MFIALNGTKDYAQSPAPAFDAVEDIKTYWGQAKWDAVFPHLCRVKDVDSFRLYLDLGGVKGYPVQALYDMINGQGAWGNAGGF